MHDNNPFDEDVLNVPFEYVRVISELSKTASKVLLYIIETSYKEDGIIYFDMKNAKFELEFKENKSIYNGLSELVNVDILAGRKDSSEFYYNPIYIEKNE